MKNQLIKEIAAKENIHIFAVDKDFVATPDNLEALQKQLELFCNKYGITIKISLLQEIFEDQKTKKQKISKRKIVEKDKNT
jgi:hypothetical protein